MDGTLTKPASIPGSDMVDGSKLLKTLLKPPEWYPDSRLRQPALSYAHGQRQVNLMETLPQAKKLRKVAGSLCGYTISQ